MTETTTRTFIFYQIWGTKHVSVNTFRQENEYTTFTQNLDLRGAVTLTCEGKIVALIRRYLENRPASEMCERSTAAGVYLLEAGSR